MYIKVVHQYFCFVNIVRKCIFEDPCQQENHNIINDWRRSVALPSGGLCDNLLEEAWYRIVSGAGEKMPTECVDMGLRCSTGDPIWLSKGKCYISYVKNTAMAGLNMKNPTYYVRKLCNSIAKEPTIKVRSAQQNANT